MGWNMIRNSFVLKVEEFWFNFIQLKESYNLALQFDTFSLSIIKILLGYFRSGVM